VATGVSRFMPPAFNSMKVLDKLLAVRFFFFWKIRQSGADPYHVDGAPFRRTTVSARLKEKVGDLESRLDHKWYKIHSSSLSIVLCCIFNLFPNKTLQSTK
jgi:hypothetical protein